MQAENVSYNPEHDSHGEVGIMPKKLKATGNGDSSETFGQRMAKFRKEAGYSQRELAAEIGISNRMIAYYEAQTESPPTHMLPQLAKALRVTCDQLLGVEKINRTSRPRDSRLWQRFSQVEKLPPVQRKQIVQVLDAFLEREKLRKTV